jgi:hypothetical protein
MESIPHPIPASVRRSAMRGLQVVLREERLIAFEQRQAQPEELDLLDALIAREQRLQVVQHAGLRRAAGDGTERPLGILRLREKDGDGGDEDDDHEPRAEPHQQDDQRDQRDELLHHLQRGIDDGERADVRPASRILQRNRRRQDFRKTAGPADRLRG